MSARAIGILDVRVDRLATSLAPLRGPRTDVGGSLAPLPLRVAAKNDGTYEVLDGFKRLARWCQDGHTHVPVVVEDTADSAVVCKARLLEANTPRRTLSPMDEVRLVRSLTDDDHLSPTQIAKVLNRGRAWVDRRLTLGRRFSAELEPHLDDGRLSVTVANSIATFPRGEQKRVAESIVRHGLRSREAEGFLSAWRIATDSVTREALSRDPRGATPQPGAPSVSSLGPTARELQARFAHTERALDELTLDLDLSGFSEPEQRVLQACQRRLAAHIRQLAHRFQHDTNQEHTPHADPRGTERASEALPRAHPHPRLDARQKRQGCARQK